MRAKLVIPLIAGGLAAAPATAALMTFEGVANGARVLAFYGGGTDGAGNSGPDFGVTFSDNLRAFVDRDDGGDGNFANEPSPNTAAATGGVGASFVMNVVSGFSGSLSFFYTHGFNEPDPGTVRIFSGIDGTGDFLGGADLPRNVFFGGECAGDPQGDFCRWDPVTVLVRGTARSVVFLGSEGRFGVDSIGFPGVPEPGSMVLLGLGLAALGAMSRRRSGSPDAAAESGRIRRVAPRIPPAAASGLRAEGFPRTAET